MDMKKILFPALAALLLLASACSQKAEYTHAIPANATFVSSVNLSTLSEKAGLGDSDNQALLQKLKESLKSEMDATTYDYIGTLLDDPAQSGIDLQAPIYLFTSRALRQGSFVAKVADKDNVQTLLETLRKEGGETEEKENCTLVHTSDGLLLGYNESLLFCLGQQTGPQLPAYKDSLVAWIQQTEAQSFASRPEFKQMQAQKGDIKAIYSYASLPKNYMTITGYRMPKGLDLKDLRFIIGLSFEKGSIDLHLTYYTENEQIKSLLAKQNQVYRPIKNTFIDYFPQSTLLLVSAGLDGNALYDLLLETTPIGENLSAKNAETIKQVMAMFEDDLSFGMVNFTLNKLPSLLAYATVKDSAPLKALLENDELKKQLGRGNDIVQLEEDRYVWKSRNFNLFFGVQDKQFYATNDELLYKDLFKKCDPSAAQNAYAGDMKGKKGFAVVNMEAICQLPIVKMLVGMGGSQYATILAALEHIDYMKSENNETGSYASIQLKDKDTNALKQIVELAKTAL